MKQKLNRYSQVHQLVKKSINAHNILIYPNPVADILTIDFDGITSTEGWIEIFDLTGNKVKAEKFKSSRDKHTFPVNDLPKGVYYLKIQNEQFQYQEKLIRP